MGRFFTSTQILNEEKLNKDAFLKKFREKMKKEGYVQCETDEGEISYSFAFSDNADCKWVTMSSESYGEGNSQAESDTARIAKMLGTTCINTVVIDSDCAILNLYDDKGKKADMLVMGRADDYFGDDIPEPKKEVWGILLSEDNNYQKLLEIQHGDYIFIEDGLSKLSALLDSGNEFIFNEADESNCNLSFKKDVPAITVTYNNQKNKVTIYSAFEDVFRNDLEKLGFKRAKGSIPTFIKMLGDEVFAVITCYKEKNRPTCKPVIDLSSEMSSPLERSMYFDKLEHFNVLISINTLYDEYAAIKVNRENLVDFFSNMELYTKINKFNLDMKYRSDIQSFTYHPDSEDSICAAMKYALELSEKNMFWIVNEIYDVKSFILTHRGILSSSFDENIYFTLDDYELFFEKECQVINDRVELELNNKIKLTEEQKSDKYKKVQRVQTERIEKYTMIKNDNRLYVDMLQKLEENKKRNISQLVKLGVK